MLVFFRRLRVAQVVMGEVGFYHLFGLKTAVFKEKIMGEGLKASPSSRYITDPTSSRVK